MRIRSRYLACAKVTVLLDLLSAPCLRDRFTVLFGTTPECPNIQ